MQRVYKRPTPKPRKLIALTTKQDRTSGPNCLYRTTLFINDFQIGNFDTLLDAQQAGDNVAIALTLVDLGRNVDIVREWQYVEKA